MEVAALLHYYTVMNTVKEGSIQAVASSSDSAALQAQEEVVVVDRTILEAEEAVDKHTAAEEVEGEGIAAGGDNWNLDSSEEEKKQLAHNVAVV